MKQVVEWVPFLKTREGEEQWGVKAKDGIIVIPASTLLDGQDCDLIARAHNARLTQPDGIMVQAIVSHRDHMPHYQFAYGEVTWEMDLRGMRTFIDHMYESLEAGLTDAFIAHFVKERLAPGATDEEQGEMVGGMMHEFRQFRELLSKPVALETPAEN